MFEEENVICLKKLNEIYFHVTCTVGQSLELKSYFQCYIKDHKFHPKVKKKIWNGKISFYKYREQHLPIGLLVPFTAFCKKFKYKYEIEEDHNPLVNSKANPPAIVEGCKQLFEGVKTNDGKDLFPYNYQMKAVYAAIKKKRGILMAATGSGKSLMTYILTRIFLNMNKKILIVVPTTTLVEQLYTDYLSYGWFDLYRDVTKLYSEVEPDFTKSVLITTWQSVYKKPGAFFHQYGAVVFDECHYNRSDSLKRIAANCVNADYRIGTTGTLPDERVDQFNIYGYLGTVIFEQYSKELIDRGILAQIEIKNLILKYSAKAVSDCKNVSYHDEVSYANNYPQRKQIYEHIFNQYVKEGQNSLVLVNKISVLLDLEKTFKKKLDSKYKIYVVYGEVETEIREHIRLMTENSENVIILSTFQCFSTGINIKRLHNVIFGSSYKSKIKVLQSIGRGLRTHESKDKMMLFDIVDDLRWLSRNGVVHHNHLFNHFLERINHYDKQKFKYHNVKIKI
jgi:superfamily II DNA or RNA helicase